MKRIYEKPEVFFENMEVENDILVTSTMDVDKETTVEGGLSRDARFSSEEDENVGW